MFFNQLTESDLVTFFQEKLNTEINYIHYNNETGELRFRHLCKRPNFHYEDQYAAVCDSKITLIPTYDVIDKRYQEYMTEKFGEEYTNFLNEQNKDAGLER